MSSRLRDRQKMLPPLEPCGGMARDVTGSTTALEPMPSLPAAPNMFTHVFLARVATQLGPLREFCRQLLQAPEVGVRQNLLASGFLLINSLTSRTALAVVHPGQRMCVALERLFKKLLESPNHFTPSAPATIAAAVELLADLCQPGLPAGFALHPPIRLLVVDDDLIARRAITGILQTIFEKPESAENGGEVLMLTAEKPFDVIFLDIVMPGMDGFEVCAKIRAAGPNRATPVVFVTSQADDQVRDQMVRCGGNNLLSKPFLTSEITVMALIFALRGRLRQLKTPSGS